ncbi:energy transducer TonB [Marinicauda salina]|uniref:Protein TonB n=1 Tax=Marinicauda salina TaxID=2135793 RepID=A0A2U2BRW0_9PROT|nr:energy transducer TonB [Marinicauda salina]PWE16750.1 energy transducer TonB [Marinicauda salina]
MKLNGFKVVCAALAMAGAVSGGAAFAEDERERVDVEAPEYPRGAERRSIEGHVTVRYNVDPEGAVTDVEVVDATPAGVFERSVLRALEGWRYAPAGETTTGHEFTFNFEFEN